ncbi:zinc finger protein 692 isoform X3 [Phaenicophaeus curvirostris]|uniref:zinc finger protein 692 isoform X3 n=1 Tax=Phaenicophaeus curvirostris TaxID=33595 RepID=UPI0037F0B9BD
MEKHQPHHFVVLFMLLVPPGAPEPWFLPAEALQDLVVLSHRHSQECGFIPDLKAPGGASRLVWECVAGHSFSWGVPADPAARPAGEDQEENSRRRSPPRRRSLRRAGLAPEATEPGGEAPASNVDQREDLGAGGDGGTSAPQAPSETGTTAKGDGSVSSREEKAESVPEEKEEQEVELQEGDEEEEEEEDDDLAYTDDLRDENYQPSLDSDSEPPRRQGHPKTRKKPVKEEPPPNEPSSSGFSSSEEKVGQPSCKRRTEGWDEDVAQIGPKRIRKAAKREILLCDFEGCGKLFSNRQYLNHHKKYQHVHQKTFACSEPTCGKSFNFKKHLKEHEKLHSDKRDYICEFCARSFRTSSNLLIHRRIHTGEKPLQCEICGFTCRQKASLNWHMKKHDADSFYQFSCDVCGKKFEKKDNVTAHKSKSHPETPTATAQNEGNRRQTEPENPEAPGEVVLEALEMSGLEERGGEAEKISGEAQRGIGEDPRASGGRGMDGGGS